MTDVTLHFKGDGQRACVVCGADLGRRVSRWWLVNCWTADPKHYRAQQTCHPAETVRPCGVLANSMTPNAGNEDGAKRPHRTDKECLTVACRLTSPRLPCYGAVSGAEK